MAHRLHECMNPKFKPTWRTRLHAALKGYLRDADVIAVETYVEELRRTSKARQSEKKCVVRGRR